jgi:peptidoglycan/xylan/chitin deacetylase (PgdA/CDA1 family)
MNNALKTILLQNSGAPTVTLPQNLITNPGTLYEDFESTTGWNVGNGSIANNTTQFQTGTQSIKGTSNSGASLMINKTTYSWSMASFGRLRLWFYLHNAVTDYSNGIELSLANDTGFSNYFYAQLSANDYLQSGWNVLDYPQGFFHVGSGSPSWASPIVALRMRNYSGSGKTCATSYDNLTFGTLGAPCVMINFDDGYVEQYNNCFAYMKPLGIPGSLYMIGTWIDGGAPYLTSAQLREMDSSRWAIGNHTHDHTTLSTLTEAQCEAELTGGIADLTAAGVPRCANYFCYPGTDNGANANTRTAMTATGILTARNSRLCFNTAGNPYQPCVLPQFDLYGIRSNGVLDTTTLVTAKAWIDQAIAGGFVASMHFHNVGAAGQMTTADYHALMDYIYAKWKAGLIYPITIDDYYKLTLGPVKIPKCK